MKTMTCRELGGACDIEFQAETFDDIAAQSQAHGMEMFSQGDADHLAAMDKMKGLMQDPDAIQKWMDEKRKLFDQR